MENMRKRVRAGLNAALAIVALAALHGPAAAQHGQTTPVLNEYFRMVFAGDVSGAPELFSGNPGDRASQMMAGRFEQRFVEKSDGLDLSRIDSPVVTSIAELFQAYWRDALMQAAPLATLEKNLKAELGRILADNGFEDEIGDEDRLLENVEALIRREGYFALSGRTPPLLELMIWTENRVARQEVELTDGTYDVDVNYLDEFVSYGWSNFATFGATSTGGWAKEDGLYCLCRHYDLESERFKLSFLKHEARHYADLSLYPELQASDLEYRGKLTELAFAENGTYRLLEHFFNSANRVPNAPHPLANWYVIEGLSGLLMDGEKPAEAEAWETIPPEQIRAAARQLLAEHDARLADIGGRTARGVIDL